MIIIAGLGNPGARYQNHRHNVGQTVVVALASQLAASAWRSKFHAEMSRASVAGEEVLLLCPMTYMNDSGRSVQAAMSFFRVPPADLVVVHDELDLPFGTLRLKQGGGHAGHNGLRSIFEALGTGSFGRLRCGIGRPPPGFTRDVADWVLSDLNSEERAEMPEVHKRAVDALLAVLHLGFATACNRVNERPKRPNKKAQSAPESAASTPTGQEPVAKREKEE